jgi:hypothetical protein
VKTPDRTTAAAFPRYAAGEVLADSASLQWPGLYVRRYRFPRVVDRFLVPATPEPLISCGLAGSAEFRERELGETWVAPATSVLSTSADARLSPLCKALGEAEQNSRDATHHGSSGRILRMAAKRRNRSSRSRSP